MVKMRNGIPIINIALAEIEVEGETAEKFAFDTAEECTIEPYLSEGEEKILRIKNRISSLYRLEDLVAGYDVTLSSNHLIPELLAVIDGGDLVYDETDPDKVTGYRGPIAGKPVVRKKFKLNLYTEERDSDGDIVKYVKFSFPHCKGTPAGFTLQEEEFFIPELVAKSRPARGERPVEIDYLDELPEVSFDEEPTETSLTDVE